MGFRWNDWNTNHIAKHGIVPDEAESVVLKARRPYPMKREDEKWLAWGPGQAGRLMQVVFVIDEDDAVYVIHARLLADAEKRRYRKLKQ